MHRLIILAFAVFLPLSACAEEDTSGERNRVRFQVSATREVPNDWATARLSVTSEGKDPAQVSADVNARMKKALEIAKRAEGIEVSSGSYSTQPVYDNRRIVRWRAQQDLRLESGDVDALSEVLGRLQDTGAALGDIQFSISKETRRALEDELIQEALGAFRARAELVAGGMGRNGWSLISLSIGDSGAPRPMMHQAEMMVSRMSAPSFEAGTGELRVSADGTIELE